MIVIREYNNLFAAGLTSLFYLLYQVIENEVVKRKEHIPVEHAEHGVCIVIGGN